MRSRQGAGSWKTAAELRNELKKWLQQYTSSGPKVDHITKSKRPFRAAEVKVEEEVRVLRMWAAVDVGQAINPYGVLNQIEGGMVQATSWTLKEAMAALPMLQELCVEIIEQPLAPNDLEGLRLLRSHSTIPIIADESCVSLDDIPRLAGVVDGVNLKLSKCGGIREALRMIHCARAHGMQVMLGCMVETTLGITAAVQLAPLVDYLDIDGAALLANDPFTGPGIEPDGRVRFNAEAGLGVGVR